MKEILDFEQENISMSQPTLDSPTIGLKNNFTISPSQNRKEHFTISPLQNRKEYFIISRTDSSPVGTKLPDPLPLTRPTYLLDVNGQGHVPD